MSDDKLQEQVCRLHCNGHEVSKIAKQLNLSTGAVRSYIAEQWREDKVAAQKNKKLTQW